MLLPLAEVATSDVRLQSLIAALHLGLQRYFKGDVGHLQLTTYSEPVGEGDQRRHFLVVLNTVPGGTGYLKELLRTPENLISMLRQAYETLVTCGCNQEAEERPCFGGPEVVLGGATGGNGEAIDILRSQDIRLPYRSVIVDEAQDMGPQALTLIRHLVPEQPDDLFIVGDEHQRIYRRRATMGQCGIKIVGRSRKLRINYRTTEETRRFATAVLEWISVDDLDGGEDTTNDYRALLHVSATRAIRQLFVSSSGQPSPYFDSALSSALQFFPSPCCSASAP